MVSGCRTCSFRADLDMTKIWRHTPTIPSWHNSCWLRLDIRMASVRDLRTGERADLAAAIAGQLGASGIDVELEPVETSTFNATWQDPESAPLRLLTWRPLFDPYTLLSLVISNTGFLSRYDNPDAQPLLEAGAIEPDPEERDRIYRELGAVLHDSPAGIYLWSLTSFYGLDRDVPPWTPRADDWILPLVVEEQS
jgi:ABC-type transport system substrate-binding protein